MQRLAFVEGTSTNDGDNREEQTAARKDALRQQFQKIEHRIKKSWELHKKYLRKNQLESARKQKIVVYNALYDFLSQMYGT